MKPDAPSLSTTRLLLRRWRREDLDAFATINADVEVMRFYPATLTRAESARSIERYERSFEEHGYGFWAVQLREPATLIGVIGLQQVNSELAIAPAVEVGWRLARPFWGLGLAHEAARAALDFGFGEHRLETILAYTSAVNVRSRRLMERLGMRHDEGADFLHPSVPAGHALQPHVVYRLPRPLRRSASGAGCP